jgi:mxaJ protein
MFSLCLNAGRELARAFEHAPFAPAKRLPARGHAGRPDPRPATSAGPARMAGGQSPAANRATGCFTSSRARRFRGFAGLLAVVLATAGAANGFAADAPRVLRVVADPNNLPFSNERREGFENKIVELVARDLHATVEYTWWAQRRGYFRNTVKAGLCDVVPGVPRELDMALTTAPYYRSSYMLVSRRDRHLAFASLDDPQLRTLRIGIQLVGDDKSAPPAAQALARRGLTANLRGFTVYGEYTQPNPPARIVEAVLSGEVDVAIVWGPLAGFLARQHRDQLDLAPLPPRDAMSAMPFAFDISMGVRRGNRALRDEIQAVLARRQPEIDAILASYGVPRTDNAN